MIKSITIEDFRNHKKKQTKFACLTAYDASLSALMSKAGVELILVGDSLGMVVRKVTILPYPFLWKIFCIILDALKEEI